VTEFNPDTRVLDEETTRLLGIRCRECNTKKVVYYIAVPMYTQKGHPVFEKGAYCYRCLLQRCRLSRRIPFPIPEELLNKLKLDMGLAIHTPPRMYRPGGLP